ncbi:MAG: hypothetical protein EA343_09105 [Nodularia sp. (in: Bacteria)]|nr:MAG: hypothetical protein EA343_09105 [Nodularia sp. (in: cyanobacteria)]
MDESNVPMMFRAQVQGRCQVHRVEKKKQIQDAEKWVNEWKKTFPKNAIPSENQPQTNKPVLRPQPKNNRGNKQNNLALARPSQAKPITSPQNSPFKLPKFGSKIETWEYTISWRLVSNSGQDEGVIRPIINAKGFPYYSGASMKGAFLRACRQICPEKTEDYCGKKLTDGSIKPGILRFHGAYPVDMNWTKSLVDIIHCQDEKQVIKDKAPNANAQISLHQVKLGFGISSKEELTDAEWEQIKAIWETALSAGIGSRVSAGYGHFQELTQAANNHNQILQIHLKGQGSTSQLVNGTKEFRPNMFKAALRGHTLRLLGGMANEETAKYITKKLWGGFNKNSSMVGFLGINFDFNPLEIKLQKNGNFYELPQGTLNIISMHRQTDDIQNKKITETAEALIKFSLMFGGFGKSWRRICHKLFYNQDYFNNYHKPIIGCHWQFIQDSELFYYPVHQLNDIAEFINDVRNTICTWIPEDKRLDTGIATWREAWYQPAVEVWGRLAEDGTSAAIQWFHGSYQDKNSIKNPHILAGSMQNTGRIWHRMYPRFVHNEKGDLVRGKGYVELLTIFPDQSSNTQNFLKFLKDHSEFEHIW